MMDRISICKALTKRNEIDPFLKRMIPHSVSRRPCQPIRDERTLNIILGLAIVHGGWRKGGQGEIEFPSNQEERSRKAPAPPKERKERRERKRNGTPKRWSNHSTKEWSFIVQLR
ncbi:hypothetical protein TNCV_440171 [Trichonephila clavipes]|nr:hypothetical protein TNCV_440171 [Trichonephila clavipes]